jgi:hypothetical protein
MARAHFKRNARICSPQSGTDAHTEGRFADSPRVLITPQDLFSANGSREWQICSRY